MILIVDSWAWLAITEEDELAERVLRHINNKNNKIFTTLLNISEIYYRIKERSSEEGAREFIESIKKNATITEMDEEIAFLAGDLHLNEKLPLVDAFVYATALKCGGYVLTGDPHFKNKKNVVYIG